jgi:hypothetical protein
MNPQKYVLAVFSLVVLIKISVVTAATTSCTKLESGSHQSRFNLVPGRLYNHQAEFLHLLPHSRPLISVLHLF